MYIDLITIKPRIGRIKSENLIIYDAFIDRQDTLLLLVNYSDAINEVYFWVTSKQIMATKINSYVEQLKTFQKKDNEITCSSSKMYTLPCVKKTRTVGMFLSCYNCGIISGYREIFGSESTTQVVAFLLFLIDNSENWPKVRKTYLKIRYNDTFFNKRFIKYLIYDDGCHLEKYITNHNNSTKFIIWSDRSQKLSKTKVVVDRIISKVM